MLHLPGGDVVAPEWQDLVRKIQQGDGLGWPGDERMYLAIGVLENTRTGKTGRRLEVYRWNEDGSETLIAHWHPSEQHRVCYDLAQMRVDRPGYVSVEDRIDQHNEAIVKQAVDKAQDEMMETLDHALRLDHDRNNPRNKFYLGGRGGARA